jgi:ribosomal protein S5
MALLSRRVSFKAHHVAGNQNGELSLTGNWLQRSIQEQF